MLLVLNRTQKTALGLLRTNVAYRFDMDDLTHSKVAKNLIARGFAKETTSAKIKAQVEETGAQQAAAMAEADLSKIPVAIAEQVAIQKAEEAEAKAKAAADEKAKSEPKK